MSYYTEYRRKKRRRERRKQREKSGAVTAPVFVGSTAAFASLDTLDLVRRSRARRGSVKRREFKSEGTDLKKSNHDEAHRKASQNNTSMEKDKHHSDHNLRERRCKERPTPGKRRVGSGLSRNFIPWCDRKKR